MRAKLTEIVKTVLQQKELTSLNQIFNPQSTHSFSCITLFHPCIPQTKTPNPMDVFESSKH